MGPGCFHPRNSDAKSTPQRRAAASMGPGCFHPRNEGRQMVAVDLQWLQWGRDVSIPEILESFIPLSINSELQWGRDVSIPEMRRF